MGYIEEFNIDVSTLFDLECVENELFDKVVYQQSIDLVDSFERIGELEDYNPILINPLLHQLDELENKMFDDIAEGQLELLESRLNESIGVILKVLESTGINMS
jgi:hypothetical protein